eukprot:484453-Prorocentrum_minimum.AAC.1
MARWKENVAHDLMRCVLSATHVVIVGAACANSSSAAVSLSSLHTTQLSRELRGIARVVGGEEDRMTGDPAPLVVFTDRRKFAVHLVDVRERRLTTVGVAANYIDQ